MNYPNIFTNAKLWHEHGITGKGVVIAVIDTGVSPHPDLTLVQGYEVSPDSDEHGHGTHVAGIAAGRKYGVAPEAKILSVKAGDRYGRVDMNAVKNGLEWLINRRKTHGERLVVNMSISLTHMPAILERINELVSLDVPVCVAACNDGGEKSALADYSAPVVVGNLISPNALHETSSCWGHDTDCAVLGTDVYSCKNTGGYRLMTGTSMATPAVAGMFALILSRWPDMPEDEAYRYFTGLCRRKVPCGSGHMIPVPAFIDDFEEVEDVQTKYIAGVGEGKRLIVRKTAETNAEKAGSLSNGDAVTVIGTDGKKSLVATGTCGWIPNGYITDEPVSEKPADNGEDVDDAGPSAPIETIKDIQAALYAWGFGPLVGEVDGKNGPKTKEAVRQFQSAMGLAADGIAGPVTVAALSGPVIEPRITEADMRCECRKYCDGYPNASTAGIRLLIERIWREHEKTRPGVVYHITNRATPAPDGAIAGGRRCERWNKERGGASGSQHRYGRAADILPKLSGVADKVLRQECEDIALKLNTRGGVGYGANHIVHVDVRGNRARWEY